MLAKKTRVEALGNVVMAKGASGISALCSFPRLVTNSSHAVLRHMHHPHPHWLLHCDFLAVDLLVPPGGAHAKVMEAVDGAGALHPLGADENTAFGETECWFVAWLACEIVCAEIREEIFVQGAGSHSR